MKFTPHTNLCNTNQLFLCSYRLAPTTSPFSSSSSSSSHHSTQQQGSGRLHQKEPRVWFRVPCVGRGRPRSASKYHPGLHYSGFSYAQCFTLSLQTRSVDGLMFLLSEEHHCETTLLLSSQLMYMACQCTSGASPQAPVAVLT